MERYVHLIDEEERIRVRVPGFDGAGFFIRRLDEENRLKILARYPVKPGASQDQAEQVRARRMVGIVQFGLLDWEGVIHPTTKLPVECTPKNKALLPPAIIGTLAAQIAARPDADDDPKEEEAETENLSEPPASAGSTPA